MNNSEKKRQDIEVEYQRWVIIIPILMILIGWLVFYLIRSYNKGIALIGGLTAFIGVLIFGVLLSVMLGIELGARVLEKQTSSQMSFREKIEADERNIKGNQPKNS
ncbi:MAG: hypothetical protein ACFFFH_10000 [Candidatus Thorarchaeota archaeon]